LFQIEGLGLSPIKLPLTRFDRRRVRRTIKEAIRGCHWFLARLEIDEDDADADVVVDGAVAGDASGSTLREDLAYLLANV
jgi:hypothetical protein